jgi:proline iminopeptidase
MGTNLRTADEAPIDPIPRGLGGLRGALGWAWRDWRIGAAAAVVAAGLYGVIAGWWTPRGPVTTPQALTAIGISLVVGVFAGLVMRSRWAMLIAPVTFAVVFELSRMSAVGPLVDGIHLTSTYGILAFALGRGVHGVLALLPMLLGVVAGAALARRLSDGGSRRDGGRGRSWRIARRAVTALVAVGVLALTLGIIRPAGTDPILTSGGKPLAGSVAELSRVEIGGRSLAMMIRGDNVKNPVLLYLAGGPGGTDIGALRRNGQGLERAFTVATYDQRGTGKSYDTLDPTSTLTLAGAVSDAIEVTNYLRARFHQNKIYLVGNSWGSILGVLAAQQHPELFAAFVGAGQMVDIKATDRLYYQDTLAWARRTGNTSVVQQLTRNSQPPYTNPLDYEPLLGNEQKVYPYDAAGLGEGAAGFSENLFFPEYSLMEQLHNLAGFLDTFTVLYPQLQNIDFRSQVTRLEIPVYLVEGRHETRARSEPAAQWFQLLQAPIKKMIIFERSGHRSLFQQPDLFYQVMSGTVLAQTATR